MKRAEAFKATAASPRRQCEGIPSWTQGAYDMVCVIEAPDNTAMSALMLNALKNGNVSGQTLRAFTPSEMEKILGEGRLKGGRKSGPRASAGLRRRRIGRT